MKNRRSRRLFISLLMLTMVIFLAPMLSGKAYADPADIGIATATWSGKTVSWTAVEGAEKYKVSLTQVPDYATEIETTDLSADFTDFINEHGGGRYVVQVRAVVNGEEGNPGRSDKYFRDVEVTPVFQTYPYKTYYEVGTTGGAVSVSSTAGETFTADEDGKYTGVVEEGSTVTVTASAANGYHFNDIVQYHKDVVATESPYSFEVANADYYLSARFLQNEPEKVTLTLKWSSIDGAAPVEDQEVKIEEGTSFTDLDYNERAAILEKFTAEGYALINGFGGAYFTPNPITSYTDMTEVVEANQIDTDLTEDTALYVLMGKATNSGSLTVEKPVCGTKVEFDQDSYDQTNGPVLTANEGSRIVPRGDSTQSYWVEIDEESGPVFLNETIKGGTSYPAVTDVMPAFGYVFTGPFGSTLDIDVTNADEGSVKYTPGLGLQFNVTAVHDPDEPVEENRVEPTTEAAGSYDEVVYCKGCGEELSRESKTIPKLPETITLTVHGSSRDGEFGDPIVINNVPKGSTYNQALAIIGKNIGSIAVEPEVAGYKYYAAWNLKKPLSSYSSMDAAKNDRFTGNEVLNEDTDSYIPYRKSIQGEITLTPPVCGTTTSDQLQFSVPDNAPWYAGTDHQQWWQYTGDIVGGNTYEYYIVIKESWGYYSDRTSTITVNGGEYSTAQMYGDERFGFRVKVTAVHDPGDPEVSDVVPATCTETGSHHELIKCKACETVTFDDEVTDDPLGHKWDSGKVTKAATEKEEGIRTYTCTVCSETRTETIPKLKPDASPLIAKLTAKGSNSLAINWTKVNGAEGYDIFFVKCGKNEKLKNIKTVKGGDTTSWTKKGLKKRTSYKVCVKAWVMKDGKKTYVKTSPEAHAYTSGGTKKYTNARSVTVKKTTVTLKKGKTYKIKASVKKLKSGKKLMPTSHTAKLRYLSTNKKVAAVNKSGKITAKGKGTCYVYVYAHNGVFKKIKVAVK